MPASSCLFNEMDRTGEDNIESRAFQLAYELSMLRFPDTATSVSEPESPSDFGQLLNPMSSIGLEETRSKKSQNMTECVPVPSSEHVAEIVGRQGKILVIHTYIHFFAKSFLPLADTKILEVIFVTIYRDDFIDLFPIYGIPITLRVIIDSSIKMRKFESLVWNY